MDTMNTVKIERRRRPFAVYLLGTIEPEGTNGAFFEEAEALESRGIVCHNPAACTFLVHFGEGAELLNDLSRVMLCHSDAVLALPGWLNSPEGRRQHHFAIAKGLPVVTIGAADWNNRLLACKAAWERDREAAEKAAGEEARE
ncbi:MAG: DUF4406 domain-containing protein [Clostridia bacterium]|nr:DUF4406 domain-containing protein [Lentisphaeria bacterium]MBR0422930.1 DUF4406 domain-containing protein [Clostridia bacterium]